MRRISIGEKWQDVREGERRLAQAVPERDSQGMLDAAEFYKRAVMAVVKHIKGQARKARKGVV